MFLLCDKIRGCLFVGFYPLWAKKVMTPTTSGLPLPNGVCWLLSKGTLDQALMAAMNIRHSFFGPVVQPARW